MIGEWFSNDIDCLLSLVADAEIRVDDDVEMRVVDDDVDIRNSDSEQTVTESGNCTSSDSNCDNISGGFNTATQETDTP